MTAVSAERIPVNLPQAIPSEPTCEICQTLYRLWQTLVTAPLKGEIAGIRRKADLLAQLVNMLENDRSIAASDIVASTLEQT